MTQPAFAVESRDTRTGGRSSAWTRWSCGGATSSAPATRCWRSRPRRRRGVHRGRHHRVHRPGRRGVAARQRQRHDLGDDWLVGTGTATLDARDRTADRPHLRGVGDASRRRHLRDRRRHSRIRRGHLDRARADRGDATSAPRRRGSTWCSPTPTEPASTPARSPARACSSRATR